MSMTGSMVLHYRIEERLGEGGMGVVYRATDTKLGRPVALKFLPAFVSQNPEEKARFLREARTASALDHPNIATIYEVNEADGKLFYAMQLVEGVTLRALREQGPVTQKQIIQIAIQIADGLAHAHERDVVHRDIKPQNIMVTTEGRAKILDFGLAVSGAEEAKGDSNASTAGTAAYLSPEQAQGGQATAKSDLFSFGVLLYELICGRPPFEGQHPAALLYSIVHEEPRPVRELAPDAPPPLVAIVERLMAKDPARRYGSAAEAANELRRLARELEFSSFSGSVKTFGRESHLGWRSVAVAGIAVVALAIWMAYLIDGGGEQLAAGDQYDVAVMYFDDLADSTRQRRNGEMVSELLITDLSSSPHLRVLSSQRLYDILKQLDREGEKRIDRTVATDIARRAGARSMITGSIAQAGERMRLTANLINVASGETIRGERVEGSDLFTMVDSLSARIRRNIRTAADADRDTSYELSVTQATTDNEEAYRHYIVGIEHYHRLEWAPALAQFDSAIALDSNFGLAYLRAGIAAFSNNRAARGYRYLAFGREALAGGYLPPRESLLVAAFATVVEDNNLNGAIRLFDELTRRFPDDKEAFFWKGTFEWQGGGTESGIADMKKALELDPTYPFALLNLVEAYKDQDDIPNAIAMAERYRTQRPGEPLPRITLAELYMRVDQFDKARREFADARALDPKSFSVAATLSEYFARTGHIDSIRAMLEPFFNDSSQVAQMTGAHSLWAQSLFLDGRFGDCFREFRTTIALERRLGDSLAVAGHIVQLAWRFLDTGEYDSTHRAFELAYRISPSDLKFSNLPFRLALARRDFDRAETVKRNLLERYAKSLDSDQMQRSELGFDAELAMERGDYATALQKFLLVRKLSGDPDDYSYWIGRAYLETGKPDSARHELQHSLTRYSPFNPMGMWIMSWYYLGRAHEALGNRGDAEEAYRTFLRYWGRADRDLDVIRQARERARDLGVAS